MKLWTIVLGVALTGAVTTASGQSASLVEQGKAAFVTQGCYGCHTLGKTGTPIAPDLSHVGAKHDHAYLTRWLQDPSSQEPAHMPKLQLTEPEVAALAAYLSSLQ